MPDKPPSYPRPDVKTLTHEEPQHLRRLVPIAQPPHAGVPPLTPIPTAKHDALPGYTRTSHIVPAAYPRTLPPESPLRRGTLGGQLKLEADTLKRSLLEAKLSSERPESQAVIRGSSEVLMWNCVDRYVPVGNARTDPESPGITLFVTHATGFPRQIWEPTLVHLTSLATHSDVRIDEIWTFECVQHGDSALINEGKHCDIFDWQDYTRDILNFLMYYLPDSPHADNLPTVFEHVAQRGHSRLRQVVGIGHSFGGATLGLAAIARPELFRSLILVEGIFFPTSYKRGRRLDQLLRAALKKTDGWPSRQHAKEAFQKHPPTRTWDPAVIDVLVEHGLVDDVADPASASQMDIGVPVRLKTRPFDEAVVYCEWLVPWEVWTAIEDLDPRVALHWIMSGDTSFATGGDAMTQRTVWRRPENSSNARLPGVGHLMVQEAPKVLATEIFRFLRTDNGKLSAKL